MTPKPRNKENRHLPKGWRYRKGRYFYRVPAGLEGLWEGRKEFCLGATLSEAFKAYSDRIKPAGSVYTMSELLDRYELEIVSRKAPATQKSNRYSIGRLRKAFGDNPAKAIEPIHVYQYQDHIARTKSPKAANLDIEVLSHAFSYAIRWGVRSDNPVAGKVRKLPLKARSRYVTDQELTAALQSAPALLVAYIGLKMLTGLRKGDLLSIRLADLQPEGIQVAVRKTGKRVVIQWSPELREAVEACKGVRPKVLSPYLFCNRKALPYIAQDGSTSGFDSIWQRWQAKLAERFTEHDLRAKVASDMGSTGEAQELLGHSSPVITERVYRRKAKVVKPADWGKTGLMGKSE